MMLLTKINGDPVIINSRQIEYIDRIPESKVIMMNGQYHIVRESLEEIIEAAVQFEQKIYGRLKVGV